MRTLSLSLVLVALALTSATATAQKQFGFDNRKSSSQPYMTPQETVAKFKVPPEFEVKLFAGEPDVANPIAFTIDEKGRVWVVECMEYPSKAGKNVPRDRIVILEDTDGDGACDKRTVFAEGKDFPVTEERKKAGLGAFDMASGIEVGHGGVFIGAPPYLWFIENKNDKPGKFEVLLKGFGSQDTHETLNTFQWGPDGWLYGLHGIYTQSNIYNADAKASPPGDGGESGIKMNAAVWRYHPRTKKFEVFAEGTSNPWGMDWRNTDGQFILACCVIPHLYHIVPGGIYRRQAGSSNNPYAYGYIQEICDHTFHKESGWAHAGLISLDVPHMPEKYRNSVIFGSIHGCMLKQNILKPNGSSYTASRGDNFLESGDKNVRPINLRWGPLGDIYMIDWHDQNPCHQAAADSWDYVRGRVYRIQLKGTKAKKAEDLGKKATAELLKLLEGTDPYLSRTAIRVLGERLEGEKNDAEAMSGASANYLKNHLSMQIGSDRKQMIGVLTSNPDRFLAAPPKFAPYQCLFIRTAAESGEATDATIQSLARIARAVDRPTVRRELASASIRLVENRDVRHTLHALMQQKEDAKDPLIPHLVWIAYEKVLTKESPKELAWLLENATGNPFITDQILPRAMRRLVATGKPTDLAACVKFVAEAKDVGVRTKALEGLATELAGRVVTPPEGWATLRDELAKQPKLLPLVNKLSVSFRDPAAVKRALEAATNLMLPVEARIEGLRQIAVLKPENIDTALLVGMVRNDPSIPVRAEAARALAAFDSKAIPGLLLAEWAKYPKAIRGDVVGTLATRKEWAKALMTAMAAKTVDRADVSDNTILRMQAFKDKELDALIEKAWGRTRATPAELAAVIDKTRQSIATGEPSFARGKVVFENHCAKCHTFDGRGSDVGPALDGAARDIDYIVTNVLDPNRVIGAPYFLRIARTVDGRIEQGVLAEEDDKFVTLKVENGVLKKIAKADLEGPLQVVEKSLMPEGLTGGMKPEEFRDLVRYLMAHPFLTNVTINGEKAAVGVTGFIPLPGGKGEGSVIEADVTAADNITTKLLLGASADYDIRLNGKPLASGTRTASRPSPDEASHDVTLAKGPHRLTVHVKDKGIGGSVFLRFLDPNRKLHQADMPTK